MEQIIMKNLDDVLENVRFELIRDNIIGCKTLMNTYLSLLDQFRNCHNYTQNKDKLIEHEKEFTNLLKESHDKINKLLYKRDYKYADATALIASRIESALFTLGNMISGRKFN